MRWVPAHVVVVVFLSCKSFIFLHIVTSAGWCSFMIWNFISFMSFLIGWTG